MLVLDRRLGQQIIISSQDIKPITLMVGSIDGGEVNLKIKAPPEVKIFRQEARRRRGGKK